MSELLSLMRCTCCGSRNLITVPNTEACIFEIRCADCKALVDRVPMFKESNEFIELNNEEVEEIESRKPKTTEEVKALGDNELCRAYYLGEIEELEFILEVMERLKHYRKIVNTISYHKPVFRSLRTTGGKYTLMFAKAFNEKEYKLLNEGLKIEKGDTNAKQKD